MRAIVFVLRGCPVGWLGGYGNEWVGTPNLDRLAAEGVVFDRHLSDCPDAEAARRAWHTGRHQMPAMDGVPPSGSRLTESTLTESLRAAGVRTIFVRANHPDTDASPLYYAVWDEVFDARPEADDASPLDALVRSFPSLLDRLAEVPRWLVWVETDRLIPPWDVPQGVFEAYVEDLEEETEEPAEEEAESEEDDDEEFVEEGEEEPAPVEVEPAEPVTPWFDPPTGPFDKTDLAAWEWLHRTFAALVTALDAELGWLFEELYTRGLDQTASWLVTSDFGYPLGEHGQLGVHRPWLHEELVHLPLILRFPGAAEAGRRVPALTQPADLMPTLLELLGADLPTALHGHSLLPLARGQVGSVRAFACSGLELAGAAEFALRTDEWALLLPTKPYPDDPPREAMLFEKPDDQWEVNDLRARHTERAEELELLLRQARLS